MTSNLGSEMIRSQTIGFAQGRETETLAEKEMREHVLEVLNKHFRPEFLNRIDEIIIFHPLSHKHIEKIVDLQLMLMQKRLLDRGITLKVKPAAKKLLAEKGFDLVYGARPLKRALQKELMDKLALLMIKGEVEKGQTLEIDARKNEIVFHTVHEGEPAKK